MGNSPLQSMMDHIEKNEGRQKKPYKIEGQLTTGVGFKVTDADAFAKLLQKTLNRIGGEANDDCKALKVDNWIGPKTTEAFGSLLKSEDPDHLAAEFGKGLGFL